MFSKVCTCVIALCIVYCESVCVSVCLPIVILGKIEKYLSRVFFFFWGGRVKQPCRSVDCQLALWDLLIVFCSMSES